MYDAFISYSHAADGRLAPALQTALHHLGKRWYSLRALRVFRDKTSLAASPALWASIEEALRQSRWFLLMASPEAARSVWVQQEIDWWIDNRDAQSMLILLTGGDLYWNYDKCDFDWKRTTAIPERLAERFHSEPLYVDLRWARDAERLTLHHTQFRAAVLDIAAPVHGRAKDEIDGEDVRQHRRTRRITWAAIVTLALLTAASTTAAYVAIQQRNLAISRELGVYSAAQLDTDPELSILLAAEGLQRARTDEAESALRRSLLEWPLRATIQVESRSPTAARFSSDGKKLITAWEGSAANISEPESGRLLAELRGHTESVSDAVFSPDGKQCATASWDNTARLWNVASGALVFKLDHPQIVTSVAYSPDGSRLATGVGDGTARLWDAQSGRLLHEFRPDAMPKQQFTFEATVGFAPDGRTLATASGNNSTLGGDKIGRIWNVFDGRMLLELRGHTSVVTRAEFSPDGRLLATASADGTARLWDAGNGENIAVLEGHSAPLTAVAFHSNGRHLITASRDGTARLWNVQGGRVERTFRGHTGFVNGAALSADGGQLLTADRDGTVRVWNTFTGEVVRELRGHYADVCCASFSPDGRLAVTGGRDGTVRVWEPGAMGRVMELQVREGGVGHAEFSPNGQWLLTSGESNWTVWDRRSGRNVHEIPRGSDTVSVAFATDSRLVVAARETGSLRFRDFPENQVRGVLRGDLKDVTWTVLGPDGRRVVTTDESGSGRLWDVHAGREIAALPHSGRITTVTFSPSSELVLTADDDSTVKLWESLTGRQTAQFREPAPVVAARFSPGGEFVLAASKWNSARIWDVRRKKVLVELVGHTGWINNGVFSSNGRQVATAGSDKTVRVWEVPTGRLIATMRPPGTINVESAVFSPDSKYLVTSGVAFGAAHVWNATTGRLVATLQVLPASQGMATVKSAVFSPDGKTVLTASNDGVGRLFPIETFQAVDELLQVARQRAKRQFTNRERFTYFHEGTPDLRPE